jgi:ATP-dependent phosphofructokinase / diphosphate-dependent phosphofructokinase
MKRIGVLTGGGDAPGLNAAIKALVVRAERENFAVVGLARGWEGLLEEGKDDNILLDSELVRRWDREGGTALGSSRTNPFAFKQGDKKTDRSAEVVRNMEQLALDALVVMGGEDTLGVGNRLSKTGVPIVGVPKTIDKDLSATDYTIGFDTALHNNTTIIEWCRTPAGSHHWVQVVEVMGRHAGHLAFWSGVAGGADIILIPEIKFDYQKLFELLHQHMERHPHGMKRVARYAVVVVSEGVAASDGGIVTLDGSLDSFGHVKLGGVGKVISDAIRKHTRYDSRHVVPGYAQRGGAPSPVDRCMGFLFGTAAVGAVLQKRWGMMVSAKGVAPACELSLVPIDQAVEKLNLLDVNLYYDAERYNVKRNYFLEPRI